ncbi:MAG: hypothetical protein ACK5MQ_04025 [Pikeienuella sp.]
MRALFLSVARIAAPALAQQGLGEGASDPGAWPGPAGAGADRPIGREETESERLRREQGIATFDARGRLRSQPEQIRRQPALTTDRLRRGQNPSYSVGPGVIIRRQP